MFLFCSGLHVCHFLLFVWVSWPIHAACKILLPPPGIEPVPSAVKVQSSNHWTTREFPPIFFFFFFYCPSVSCSMQDLHCWVQDLCHSMWDLQLQHAGSSSPIMDQTWALLHWEHGVLTTWPPGKSLLHFKSIFLLVHFPLVWQTELIHRRPLYLPVQK